MTAGRQSPSAKSSSTKRDARKATCRRMPATGGVAHFPATAFMMKAAAAVAASVSPTITTGASRLWSKRFRSLTGQPRMPEGFLVATVVVRGAGVVRPVFDDMTWCVVLLRKWLAKRFDAVVGCSILRVG